MSRSESGRLGQIASKTTRDAKHQGNLLAYAANPILCLHCQTPIAYEKRHDSTFCDHTCAATYNNARRNAGRVYATCACGSNVLKRNTKWCAICISQSKHGNQKNDITTIQSAKALRRYLLRTRPHTCENPECGLSLWCGQPIPLEMDHIDGNSENNTEENLRLICVNCHALTPTYRNKNKGNGRHARRQRYADGKSY